MSVSDDCFGLKPPFPELYASSAFSPARLQSETTMEEGQVQAGEFSYLENQNQGNVIPIHVEQEGSGPKTDDVIIGHYCNHDHAVEIQDLSNGWDANLHEMQAMNNNHYQQQQQVDFYQNNETQDFNSTVLPTETLYNPTPELLNLFHLTRGTNTSSPSIYPCSSSIVFANTNEKTATNAQNISVGGLLGDSYLPLEGHTDASWLSSSVLYDPLFHLSHVPPQPPIIKDLFRSLPSHGHYDLNDISSSKEGDEGGGRGFVYGEDNGDARKYEKRLLEFGTDVEACIVKRKKVKLTEHYTTERDRRTQLNQKYDTLKSLIPNPTKSDRASVVGDAIDYIQELKRTVNELRLLVERKRHGKNRNRRLPNEHNDGIGDIDGESTITKLPLAEPDQSSYSGTLRTSWLRRKSKVTLLDVRIIDDEVTIKIMQRKRINCLLHVARVLNELQLDLCHVAGGQIGEHFSFLFNTKILEGSLVHASAIASKLMESVDNQAGARSPSS